MVLKRIVDVVQVIAVISAAVFVFMLLFHDPDDGPAPTANGVADGAAVFAANCSGCHGDNGEGASAPQLAGVVEDRFPDVDDQISFVTNGGGGMPSFGGQLSDEEIEAVVVYTRDEL